MLKNPRTICSCRTEYLGKGIDEAGRQLMTTRSENTRAQERDAKELWMSRTVEEEESNLLTIGTGDAEIG